MSESNIMLSDPQDHEVDKKTHHRLLESLTQYIKKPVRNEPSFKRSEFHLVKTKSDGDAFPGATTLAVPNLVKVLQKSKKLENVGTALKKSLRNKKVLKKPLEKPVVERINRSINYEKAKKKLNQWNAVVAANRAADHLSFPLQTKNSDMEVYVSPYTDASKFRVKSDLMVEMEKREARPDVEANANMEDVEKLTREEMIARSKELRLIRIRESQKNAKARMQNKIKSKKFHKIMKKEKLKEEIKNFQLLQKSDPEAAIRKLDQIEKRRVEERALLRHKNTGTWAKNLQIRSKYDKDARKELAQQLSISRELTQVSRKPIDEDDSDMEESSDDEPINVFNPWKKPHLTFDEDHENAEVDGPAEGYRKYWNTRNANEEALEVNRASDDNEDAPEIDEQENVNGWLVEEYSETATNKRRKPKSIVNEDVLDDIFDEAEEFLQKKVSRKLSKLQSGIADESDGPKKKSTSGKAYREDLNFKKQHSRPDLDEELNETHFEDESKNERVNLAMAKLSNESPDPKQTGNINPDEFMKTKKIYLKTTLPNIDQGENDEMDAAMEKQLTISEAFEDDDIVNDFQQENADEDEKKQPKDIDLTLPGWGSWGGCGIKPRSKKLIIKFPKEEQRREENKGHVIIVDEKNDGLRKHQVSNLPFPFTSVKEYEAALRAPVGREFVPEIAHNLLTKPAVTTQLGTIIKPMDRDVLLKQGKKRLNKTDRRIVRMEKRRSVQA
ncbi:hypothetical protein HA402_009316 [Bradysia odoriphaga]|nr:hypothetical protein HA402_009316 [Bradysia odoriphaga]